MTSWTIQNDQVRIVVRLPSGETLELSKVEATTLSRQLTHVVNTCPQR